MLKILFNIMLNHTLLIILLTDTCFLNIYLFGVLLYSQPVSLLSSLTGFGKHFNAVVRGVKTVVTSWC